MPPAGFEPAIPAGERLQTHALDRSATGIGPIYGIFNVNKDKVRPGTDHEGPERE